MDISRCIICLYLLYFKDFDFVETRKHGKGVREKSRKRDDKKEKFFLNGQFSKDTGIVELQHSGHRGSICGEFWTSQDARFVCRKILNNEQASAEKLKITNPLAYGYKGSVGFRRLGCQYTSYSLQDCNVTELPFGETSASGCGKDTSLAAVCCKQDMEKGVYSENRAVYFTYCPCTWIKQSCYTGYSSLRYNDSRPIQGIRFNSDTYWTSSRIEAYTIGHSCMRVFSELLNNSIDTADCSDIHQTCLMVQKQYYIKLDNSCICLDEDVAKGTILDNRCQDESTATDIEQNRSGLRSIQVYRLNISEDKDINSSKCIQVHVKNNEKKFSVENCEMLRQVICLENICKSQSCQNSGICVPNSDYQGFTCKCIANYIGEKCEHDPCYPSRPCSNIPNALCKVNENRTGHVCIPNGNVNFTRTTQRPKTHAIPSNKETTYVSDKLPSFKITGHPSTDKLQNQSVGMEGHDHEPESVPVAAIVVPVVIIVVAAGVGAFCVLRKRYVQKRQCKRNDQTSNPSTKEIDMDKIEYMNDYMALQKPSDPDHNYSVIQGNRTTEYVNET